VMARNGLVDRLRKTHRNDGYLHTAATADLMSAADAAEVNVQHEQFVSAIRACVATLAPRARIVWSFRVFLDMPSKKIAAHPDVRMTPAAVDMLFSRTRQMLRACMESKGFNSDDAPPGTFVALWQMLHDPTRAPKERG